MKSLKVSIEIPEGIEVKWVDNVLTLVDIEPENIMDKIKTFEDAIIYLSRDNDLVYDYRHCSPRSKSLEAFLKLRIIVKALNENWTPKFTKDEEKWFPVFDLEYNSDNDYSPSVKSFFSSSYGSDAAISYVSFDLLFKSKELSDYCAEQFKDLWSAYLINK